MRNQLCVRAEIVLLHLKAALMSLISLPGISVSLLGLYGWDIHTRHTLYVISRENIIGIHAEESLLRAGGTTVEDYCYSSWNWSDEGAVKDYDEILAPASMTEISICEKSITVWILFRHEFYFLVKNLSPRELRKRRTLGEGGVWTIHLFPLTADSPPFIYLIGQLDLLSSDSLWQLILFSPSKLWFMPIGFNLK